MNTALKTTYIDNVIPFPGAVNNRRTTSIYKSDGKPKATPADPIRDPADIERIKDYFLSKGQRRNYTIFMVGIIFGLRASDLLSLRVHHILNPDGGFKSHCDIIESKTRKYNRPNIDAKMRTFLADYLDWLGDYDYDDYLFRSKKKDTEGKWRAIDVTSFNRILAKTSRELGLNFHFSSHSLRKTFAYQLLQQNPADDEAKFALQRMLNHNDFKTTITYCGLQQDTLDKYRDGLAEAFI